MAFHPIIAFGSLFMLFFILAVAAFAFWVWMIIDCAERKFKDKNDKLIWILVIIFLNWVGALIYYFVVKSKSKK